MRSKSENRAVGAKKLVVLGGIFRIFRKNTPPLLIAIWVQGGVFLRGIHVIYAHVFPTIFEISENVIYAHVIFFAAFGGVFQYLTRFSGYNVSKNA